MILLNDFFTLQSHEQVGGEYIFKILLNPEHVIFKAHFPGNPIVPGVCQIQIAKELLEFVLKRPLCLVGAKNVKYMAVMTPQDLQSCYVRFSKIDSGSQDCKAVVIMYTSDKQYSKLSLVFNYPK